MFRLCLLTCVWVTAASSIFGEQGAKSAVPANTAQYLLDLESKSVNLHYFGDQQIFVFVLSPALRKHLQDVASKPKFNGEDMPVVYGVGHLSDGPEGRQCDWNRVPGWSSPTSGADAKHVFYGREVREAPNTPFGNAIHLCLGPEDDEEGWTSEEMSENFAFWKGIHQEGEPVFVADGVRQFRTNIAGKLGGTFAQRWGTAVTTKAHRFTLQMYTSQSQADVQSFGGAQFFETFPNAMPPTKEVVFVEAEDGCKGTPCPASAAGTHTLYESTKVSQQVFRGSSAGSTAFVAMAIVSLGVIGVAVAVRSRSRSSDSEYATIEE